MSSRNHERFLSMPRLHDRIDGRLHDLETRPSTTVLPPVDAGGDEWQTSNDNWIDPNTCPLWSELRVENTPGDVDELYRCLDAGGGAKVWSLVAPSSGGGVAGTNLSWSAGTRTVASDTGSNAVITEATTSLPGLMSSSDKTKLDGVETAADVTDATNVSAAGAPIITSGAGNPSSTPSKVGDVYIDTTNDNAWTAVGTASSDDWRRATESSWFNVKDYGATGDGTTDDTTSIQDAIDAAELVSTTTYGDGAIVYLPAGDYLISATLTVQEHGITLKGDGRTATRIKYNTTSDDYIHFATATPATEKLTGGGVEDMTIQSSNTAATTGGSQILLERCTETLLRNLYLINGHIGIRFAGCGESCTATNVDIAQTDEDLGNGATGILIDRAVIDSSDTGNAEYDEEDDEWYTESNSVYLSDLNIRSQGADYCIDVKAVDGLYVTNCHLGFADVALVRYIEEQVPSTTYTTTDPLGINNVQFSNVFFDGNSTSYGVRYQATNTANATGSWVHSHTYQNCRFGGGANNFTSAVIIQNQVNDRPQRVSFVGGEVKNVNEIAFDVQDGYYVRLSDYVFYNTNQDDPGVTDHATVHIRGSDTTTETAYVQVHGCSFMDGYRGIQVNTTTQYVSLVGNVFDGDESWDRPILIGAGSYNDQYVIASNQYNFTDGTLADGGTDASVELLLHSPDGNPWKVTVNNSGTLTATDLDP